MQLFIRNIDGSQPVQLTFNKDRSWMPSICPDGQKIAYVMSKNTSIEIYLIHMDGTGNQQITFGGLNITPVWNPDGKYILYTHAINGGKVPRRIYKMNPDGSNKENLINETGDFSDMVPSISPDGSQFVFTSDRSGPEQFEIWRADIDGNNLVRLTHVAYDEDIQANI